MTHPVKAASSGAPKQVSTNQIVTTCDKFGRTPDAVEYQPEFLDRVYVVGPETGAQQVNPMYCLSVPSAFELCYILRDLNPVMWKADPSPMAGGSPFQYTEEVPWATFSNGAQRNLGTLAYYWKGNSGNPGGNTAEKNARTDIAFG